MAPDDMDATGGPPETESVRAANRAVRDLVNETRRHWKLREKGQEEFSQVCAALDVIDDAESAIGAYTDRQSDVGPGTRYLLTYGVLEALHLQQDAVGHLCGALGMDWSPKDDDVLRGIRDIRNKACSHSTRKTRPNKKNPTFHQIVQHSLRPGGFELQTHSARGEFSVEHVDLIKMIEDQRDRIRERLNQLAAKLTREDMVHRRKHRALKLAAIFERSDLGYAYEKLAEGKERSMGMMGAGGVQVLSEVLESFSDALVERGLGIGTYAGVRHHFEEAKHGLGQLAAYYESGAVSEIPNDRSARIYAHYVRDQLRDLERLARQIDEEYQHDD